MLYVCVVCEQYAMSIPYLISACASPFLGGIVDKFGHRVVLTSLSALVLTIVHMTFAFGGAGPHLLFMYLPLIGQGVAYSVYASALWPSIQMVVQKNEVGTAYGVVTAIQNGGLFLFPLIVGALKAQTGSYAPWVEVFFSSLAGVGVLSGFVLYGVDRAQLGGVLDKPGDSSSSSGGDDSIQA